LSLTSYSRDSSVNISHLELTEFCTLLIVIKGIILFFGKILNIFGKILNTFPWSGYSQPHRRIQPAMKLKFNYVVIAFLMALCLIMGTLSQVRSEEERMLQNLSANAQLADTLVSIVSADESDDFSRLGSECPVVSLSQLAGFGINLAAIEDSSVSEEFKGSSLTLSNSDSIPLIAGPVPGYKPREQVRLAHPSNYGNRYRVDALGKPVTQEYIVVLHETVYSADSAINYFQTPHPKDQDQASYHTLIRRNGTVVYVVPPEKRAFGAGNSVFTGTKGTETVQTDRKLPPSVNNFAYHISLETPSDGANKNGVHSGYTDLQYQSLAWLISKTSIPESRITTHRAVDRSGSRTDPRSFNRNRFLPVLRGYSRSVRSAQQSGCSPALTAQQP
jgi:N-acetylmuramoyl-L-alanine amidase